MREIFGHFRAKPRICDGHRHSESVKRPEFFAFIYKYVYRHEDLTAYTGITYTASDHILACPYHRYAHGLVERNEA